ncbi:TatD family hydrolase [Candidatus Woesebacteria bacterium]|nr:TatD family hydrolase [Candidatus Woesebacteria bacterium]MCD8527146.1 TatD family hydrolase [Candidatus Woesebacteria bacterium]MCD8546818.1 TatD family hydrolase [Candidatus Woesebacteria bacterium]
MSANPTAKTTDFSRAVHHFGFRSIIDTHCHYNMEPHYEAWQEQWQKAKENGVQFAWIPGTTVDTSRRAVELSQAESAFTPFLGVHPTDVVESEFDLDMTLSQLKRLKQKADDAGVTVGGVGEVGLDYFRLKKDDQFTRQQQRLWLRAFLEVANEWELPVILHVRDQETPEEPTPDNAYWDTYKIVQEVGIHADFTMHCVSGPLAYVDKMLSLGAYAGFDGNITYPNAHRIREIWRKVPADRRLLETDAPFLPPQPYRGQVCEPWMIRETAEWIRENLSL